jgi:hypothetical protein
MTCPTCGVTTGPDLKYCPSCGRPLGAVGSDAVRTDPVGPLYVPGQPASSPVSPVPPPVRPVYGQFDPRTQAWPPPVEPQMPVYSSRSRPGGALDQRWIIGILAAALVVALAAFIGIRASRQPTVPPSASTVRTPGAADTRTQAAAAQVRAIDALIVSTRASRAKLGQALADIDGCQNLGAAVQALREVATERATEGQRAGALVVDALDNGALLRDLLVQAMGGSLLADQYFLAWGQSLLGDCPGSAPHTGDYNQAEDASRNVDPVKEQFIAEWNPVAAEFGLPSRTSLDL